ncbi:MAG: RidA family protein [Cyanophyceae cyanobacterium]
MSRDIANPLARYAAYRRVGDLVFLSGVIAVDPRQRKVIQDYADIPSHARELLGETGEFSVDAKEGPILVQSWYIFDKIQQTVEDAGGQLQDVFKLVQYFKDLRDFPLYSRVRNLFFPDQPPASTIVEVSGMLPTPEVMIEVEATAYIPKEKISTETQAS